MIRNPKTGLKVRDHGNIFFSHKRCFKASELIGWLMSQLNLHEQEAMEVGKKLLDMKYMHKVKDPSSYIFENSIDLYRFQEDVDPSILNMKRLWLGVPKTASEVANQLRQLILKISDNFVSKFIFT